MGTFLTNSQISQFTLSDFIAESRLSTFFKIHMKRMLFLSFILFFAACSTTSHGQTKVSKKAQEAYKEGSEHLVWDRFSEAEKSFLEALKHAPEYEAAMDKLAFVYVKTFKYENAYQTLNKIIRNNPKAARDIYLVLAKMSLATSRIEEGLSALKQYRLIGSLSSAAEAEAQRVEENLLFVKEYKEKNPNQPKVSIIPLNPYINTSEREYFPTITADGNKLYFNRLVRPQNKQVNEDIFVSEWTGNDWSEPVSISPNINTHYNEASPTITPDGRRLFLTICESPENYGACDIWVSDKVGEEWVVPVNLGPTINGKFKDTQPCLSGDGRSLYFVSNRKGGQGGFDIWVSNLQKDGTWGEPENLGADINTPFDEQRPFIHPDNKTLYFTSDGHPGFGNTDIFMSKKKTEKGKWGKPVNIGLPINSYENDEGIFVSLDGATGYLASDRFPSDETEKRNFDIYSFSVKKEVKPNEMTFVKGYVYDSETKKGVAAEIEFIDLETKVIVNRSVSDPKSGEYLLTLEKGKDYAMNIAKSGYMFHSHNFALVNLKPGENFKLNATLSKIKAGEKTALRNIFFKFNSAELQLSSETELEILIEFMNENPKVKIEIEGHTDIIGKPEYNKELSEKRAKAVYDYLVNYGIDKKRLTFKGYGELQPLASNDTEAGRALNRRTEFRIISN